MNKHSGSLEWSRFCYGVDVCGERLVAVRGDRIRGRVECTPVLAGDQARWRALREAGLVVGCLSARESFVRGLEAPFASYRKALRVLPALLDIELPFPLEECVYQFLPAASPREGSTRALAAGARAEDVARKLQAYASVRIDPTVLDQEGIALWTQALHEHPVAENTARWRVVVYSGVGRVALALGRGSEFVGAHAMGEFSAAAVARLLRARIAADQPSDVEWLWCGSAAESSDLSRLGDQVPQEWRGPSRAVEDPAHFLARALVTRVLLSGPLRCNLRRGRFLHETLRRRTESIGRRATLLAMAAGLLLCVGNLAASILAAQREADIDRSFAALADRVAGFHVAAKGEHAVRIASASASARTAALRNVSDAFGASLLDTVSTVRDAARENDLRIGTLVLRPRTASLSGTAGEWDRCEYLVPPLEAAGYTVTLVRSDAAADGRIPFTLQAGDDVE